MYATNGEPVFSKEPSKYVYEAYPSTASEPMIFIFGEISIPFNSLTFEVFKPLNAKLVISTTSRPPCVCGILKIFL